MKKSLLALAVAAAACSDSVSNTATDPLANITPPGAPFACTSSQLLSLAIGEVRAGLDGGRVCLNTTAGADYMITAFSGSKAPSANSQVSLTGYGVTAASAAAR